MALAFGAALGNNATFDPGTPASSRGFAHSGVPSGGHIIVGAAWYADSNGATFSSLSGGLSWTTDHIATPNADTNFTIGVFSAPAPSGLSAGTITITLTATAYGLNVGGIYATGVATSSYEDTSTVTNHPSTTGWGSAITTTNADDLIVGFGYSESEFTSTPLTNYTEALDWTHTGLNNAESMVYRIVASTGTYTPGGTWSGSPGPSHSIAVAYKADSGAVWPPGDNPAAPPLRLARSNLRLG